MKLLKLESWLIGYLASSDSNSTRKLCLRFPWQNPFAHMFYISSWSAGERTKLERWLEKHNVTFEYVPVWKY